VITWQCYLLGNSPEQGGKQLQGSGVVPVASPAEVAVPRLKVQPGERRDVKGVRSMQQAAAGRRGSCSV